MKRTLVVGAPIFIGCVVMSLMVGRNSVGQAPEAAGGQLPGKFVHVALYDFKADAPEGTAERFAEEANACFAEIASVRGFRVGPQAKRGTPAKFSVQPAVDFQIGVVLCFDDFAGLAAYGNHPKHNELKKKYGSLFGKIVTYDFESE